MKPLSNKAHLLSLILIANALTFTGCKKTIATLETKDSIFLGKVDSIPVTANVYNPETNEYKRIDTLVSAQILSEKWIEKQKEQNKDLNQLPPLQTPTGFFRTQKIGSRWWLFDPQGHPFYNKGINSIYTGKSARSREAFQHQFESEKKWMTETIQLLQDNEFNCAGSWSNVELIREHNKTTKNPFPYYYNLLWMQQYAKQKKLHYKAPMHKNYPYGAIHVFDPEFKVFCKEQAKALDTLKGDKNLIGYFSDNELPVYRSALYDFLKLPEGTSGKEAAKKWLIDQGISHDQITRNHLNLFSAFVLKTYFDIVVPIIKEIDPNHLYVGCRLHADQPYIKEVMEIAGAYQDIVSINYYYQWTPNPEHMNNWDVWTQKPFMVTEFYTKAANSGLPNTTGAGWIVPNQRTRGWFYQNYTLALLDAKNCVGWHHFKYMDDDPLDSTRSVENKGSNKGILNFKYHKYTDFLAEVKKLNTDATRILNH